MATVEEDDFQVEEQEYQFSDEDPDTQVYSQRSATSSFLWRFVRFIVIVVAVAMVVMAGYKHFRQKPKKSAKGKSPPAVTANKAASSSSKVPAAPTHAAVPPKPAASAVSATASVPAASQVTASQPVTAPQVAAPQAVQGAHVAWPTAPGTEQHYAQPSGAKTLAGLESQVGQVQTEASTQIGANTHSMETRQGGAVPSVGLQAAPMGGAGLTAQQLKGYQQAVDDLKQQVSRLAKAVEGVTQRLTTFAESHASNQGRINRVEQGLQQVNKLLVNVNGTVQQLVTKSQHQQRQQQAAWQTLEARLPPKPQAKTLDESRYYVRAVIPGRAWLKDREGNVLTVVIGDELPGYGKVTEVDPLHGVVVTSKGAKFRFGMEGG